MIASSDNVTLQQFDGVVMLEVSTLQNLEDAFADSYYTDTVAPAEQQIFDWINFPQGVVASFNGSLVKVIEDGKDVLGRIVERSRCPASQLCYQISEIPFETSRSSSSVVTTSSRIRS